MPTIESQWIALSRDYDTQQAAYTELLTKAEQARVAADLERRQVDEQFRVLDPPQVPIEATGPDRVRNTALGTVGSLLLGLVLAAAVEVRDSTFRTENEIVEVLTLPVVALLPYIESQADRRRQRMRQLLSFGTAAVGLVVGGYTFWMLELWRYIR